MLGKAECGECGGTKTLEVRGKGEIWSRCLGCGFQEWEWLYGDNPDYLSYLAEQYHTTVEEIKRALKGKTETPTRIQTTILEQLHALNPFFMAVYGDEVIPIAMDDGRTLRLHIRQRRKVCNIDITYDAGMDAYNVKAHRLTNHGLNCKLIYDKKGFMWDMLEDAISEILRKLAEN